MTIDEIIKKIPKEEFTIHHRGENRPQTKVVDKAYADKLEAIIRKLEEQRDHSLGQDYVWCVDNLNGELAHIAESK